VNLTGVLILFSVYSLWLTSIANKSTMSRCTVSFCLMPKSSLSRIAPVVAARSSLRQMLQRQVLGRFLCSRMMVGAAFSR